MCVFVQGFEYREGWGESHPKLLIPPWKNPPRLPSFHQKLIRTLHPPSTPSPD